MKTNKYTVILSDKHGRLSIQYVESYDLEWAKADALTKKENDPLAEGPYTSHFVFKGIVKPIW